MNCYYCKSINVQIYLQVDSIYALYICHNCSIIFTYPQPSNSDNRIINQKKYDSTEEFKSRLAIFDAEYKRANLHIHELKRFQSRGVLLDVGCSYGITVKAARGAGFSAFGVEPAKSAALYGRNNLKLNIFLGTLSEAKFENRQFDVITLYDVLEHVPILQEFLQEIQRILKDDGLLVIQSPNIESFAAYVLKTNWNWLVVPQHLWHFSKKSICRILADNRFRVMWYLTEDNVYDFASNFVSSLPPGVQSQKIWSKALRKVIYSGVSCGITIGTHVWKQYSKGGVLRVYAKKSQLRG